MTYDAATGTRTERFAVTYYGGGLGDLPGAQVVGITPDKQLVYEDGGQVFRAALDGSNRRAVTPPLPQFGIGMTHLLSLSPQADQLLYIPVDRKNQATVYDVATGKATTYLLPPEQAPVALLSNHQLRVMRYDKPYDPQQKEPYRQTLGYATVDLASLPN